MMLNGDLPEAFECTVRGRIVLPHAIVELHDYRFIRPQRALFESALPFLDLALSHRPGAPAGYYLDAATPVARIGDILFIPAGRKLRSEWGQGVQRSICCQFDSQLDAAKPAWSPDQLRASLDIRSPFVRDALIRLAHEVEQPGFCSDLMADALCTQLAIELGRYFLDIQQAATGATRRLSPAQLRALEERLEAPGKPPTVAALAAQCGLSTRHFFRIFRATTGMTLSDYAAQGRIARAKSLLRGDARSIKQIAYRCGFQTQAAFSAAFRRATGVSPRDYRDQTTH
jgi:AraC family transcriptional regulator